MLPGLWSITYFMSNGGSGAYQKTLISPLSLVLGVWNGKTISWKSWSANILQVSNLTSAPCFKVMWGHHAKSALYLPYNLFWGFKI